MAMRPIRKILGFLIIVFIGLPLLFAIIWAVGITKAAVSPEFVTELPQEIIAEFPETLDEIFEEAQRDDIIKDENTKAWFRAAAKVGTSPQELMRETGLLDWMENELSDTLEEVGDVLRGESRVRPRTLDLRPLKQALTSDAIDRYIMEILEQFPPCDEEGVRLWQQVITRDGDWWDFPACRPDLSVVEWALSNKKALLIDDIDDEVEIFSGDVHFWPFGISRTVTLLSYALFLLPLLFIFLGSVIAATSPASFCRWFGISTFLGSLPVLIIALFARNVGTWALNWMPYAQSEGWSTGLEALVVEKTAWIQYAVFDFLFSPVVNLAVICCVIGILVIILSFFMRGETRTRTVAVPAKQQPVRKEAEPEEKKSDLVDKE